MYQETNRILDCLALLDRAVGKTSHRDYVAVSFPNTATWEERQRLVWSISVDVGLPYDFRVRSLPLGPGVAAEIDLYPTGAVVDVRTCPSLHFYPWNYYSAICRELSRMYLKCHRLDFADELLIDVCAVYLGFGGYLLNGKIAENILDGLNDDAGPSAACPLASGYLTASQLQFAFRYVCQMRKIHPCVAYHGICDLNCAYADLEDPYAQRLTAEFQSAVAADTILKSEFDRMTREKGRRRKLVRLIALDPHLRIEEFDPDEETVEKPKVKDEISGGDGEMLIFIFVIIILVLLWCLIAPYCRIETSL